MRVGCSLSCCFVLLSAACGGNATTAPSASAQALAASSPAPRPSSAAPEASAPASSAPVASSTPEVSPEPELAEWGKVREIKVAGSGKNSCETKLVREWLRVMCVNRAADLGKPVRIEVKKGRAQSERSKGENLKAVNDITTLVVPVRPGADIEATFIWENGEHTLTATWPAGSGESGRSIAFDDGDDAAPKAAESATDPGVPAPSASASSGPKPAGSAAPAK